MQKSFDSNEPVPGVYGGATRACEPTRTGWSFLQFCCSWPFDLNFVAIPPSCRRSGKMRLLGLLSILGLALADVPTDKPSQRQLDFDDSILPGLNGSLRWAKRGDNRPDPNQLNGLPPMQWNSSLIKDPTARRPMDRESFAVIVVEKGSTSSFLTRDSIISGYAIMHTCVHLHYIR